MPDRFKETGYASTRQDAIKPYYPDVEYKRFNGIDKIYLDKRDEMPDSYEVFTPRPRRFIGKDGNVHVERYKIQLHVVYLLILYLLSLML